MNEDRIRELTQPKIPFGMPTGKQTSRQYMQSLISKGSIDKFSSPRISQDETGLDTHLTSRMINGPMVKGVGANSARRNFVIPGSITLDTDSEADASKLFLREKLMNTNTTRNIRNRTIDPDLHGVASSVRPSNFRSPLSNMGIGGKNFGNKKQSLQHH